jgi:hypothetical protein
MNITEFDKLIREFEILPKCISETTFMNICKHSRSRFEEICSRILSFYLQPSNEHGLKDLVLSSFFELVVTENPFSFYNEKISVETEAYIEGKFLDILVKGESFTLGIENKIGAELYNDLSVYKKLIEQIHKTNNYKVVLSVRKIEKEYELKKIEENGFLKIYYSDLFRVIKNNIGNYYSNANSKYVTFLFDFINTIENMSKSTIIDDPQSLFFFDNSKKIEELITQFNNHSNRVLDIQKSNIATLKDEISIKSGVTWWVWQGWDLGYAEFDKAMPRIGVESSYETHSYDPLKKFRIFITTWNLQDWNFYEKDVLKKYSRDKFFLDTQTDNRAYLHMGVIEDNNQELIVEKLYEYYSFLKELVETKKLPTTSGLAQGGV